MAEKIKNSCKVINYMLIYHLQAVNGMTGKPEKAAVAELADAYDSKSYGKPYGFKSHQRHFRMDLSKLRISIFAGGKFVRKFYKGIL